MNLENNNEIRYSIIKKYFHDTANEEEKNLVSNWLNLEDKIKSESYLRLLWKEMDLDANEPTIDLNALLDKIHHTIHLARAREKTSSFPGRSKPVISFNLVLRNIARIAAILLLPLAIYLGWEVYSQKMWMTNQTEIVYNEIICPLGVRSQFELPDGTRGHLNNGSRLKYPVKFSGNTREVELAGEAFFDVSHNKTKPFIINTEGLNIKVLGTRLNVCSYSGEGYQEFFLESGKMELIKVENDREIIIAKMKPGQHLSYSYEKEKVAIEPEKLASETMTINQIKSNEELGEILKKMKPGQRAVYEMEEGQLDIKFDKADNYHYTTWKEGKLVLRNDPMDHLLKRIERWYNVRFNVMDERIYEYTYWATFEEETLDRVLKLLSLTGPIRFEKRLKEQMADGTYKAQEINVMIK